MPYTVVINGASSVELAVGCETSVTVAVSSMMMMLLFVTVICLGYNKPKLLFHLKVCKLMHFFAVAC